METFFCVISVEVSNKTTHNEKELGIRIVLKIPRNSIKAFVTVHCLCSVSLCGLTRALHLQVGVGEPGGGCGVAAGGVLPHPLHEPDRVTEHGHGHQG